MPQTSPLPFEKPIAAKESDTGVSDGFRSFSKRQDEAAMEMCECLIDIAAAFFSISSKYLRTSGRSSMAASRVRQVAMYIAHVVLGLTQTEVGRGFGRDRTTVTHACQVVEDLRDDLEFDQIVLKFELIAHAAFRNRLEF